MISYACYLKYTRHGTYSDFDVTVDTSGIGKVDVDAPLLLNIDYHPYTETIFGTTMNNDVVAVVDECAAFPQILQHRILNAYSFHSEFKYKNDIVDWSENAASERGIKIDTPREYVWLARKIDSICGELPSKSPVWFRYEMIKALKQDLAEYLQDRYREENKTTEPQSIEELARFYAAIDKAHLKETYKSIEDKTSPEALELKALIDQPAQEFLLQQHRGTLYELYKWSVSFASGPFAFIRSFPTRTCRKEEFDRVFKPAMLSTYGLDRVFNSGQRHSSLKDTSCDNSWMPQGASRLASLDEKHLNARNCLVRFFKKAVAHRQSKNFSETSLTMRHSTS